MDFIQLLDDPKYVHEVINKTFIPCRIRITVPFDFPLAVKYTTMLHLINKKMLQCCI